jgi:lipoprotein-releasing system permease protein
MLEGMMMSLLGAGTGMLFALIICLIQQYIGVIEMPGQTFVVKYYPVKIMLTDFLLVGIIVVVISMLMAWLPARRAVKNFMDLRIR